MNRSKIEIYFVGQCAVRSAQFKCDLFLLLFLPGICFFIRYIKMNFENVFLCEVFICLCINVRSQIEIFFVHFSFNLSKLIK